MNAYKPKAARLYNWPASYHGGKSALNFADGHSELHRWRDPRTTRKIGNLLSSPDGTASPNNPDVEWMLRNATAQK